MSAITFSHSLILAALAIVPVALAWWLVANRRALRRAKLLSRAGAASPPYTAAVCLALAAASGIVAAAGPRWGDTQRYLPRNGAETVFVLDVSRSMDTPDVAPSRLEAAKQALTKTLGRLNGDRVGLVIFAGNGRLRIPLTEDLAAATQVVSTLETGSILVQGGTNGATGLDIALDTFDKAIDVGKLVVFISDGDDLGGDPASVAERVHASGVNLIVAGVGTAGGGTVPVYDVRNKTTVPKIGGDGLPIVSKLGEPFLRALAVASGGRYVGSDIAALPGAVEGQVTSLKRQQIDSRPTTVPTERFQWFGVGAILFLVAASIAEYVRPSRRKAAAAGLAFASLFLVGCATEAHDLNEDGRLALRSGDTSRAIDLFLNARNRQPDNPEISLNLSYAYEAAGRHDEADQAAKRVLGYSDAKLRGRAQAAVGHFEFNAGHLELSLDAFKQALLENPQDEASRHDFEVVARLLIPPDQPPTPTPTPTPAPGDQTPASGAGTPTPGASATPSPGSRPPGPPGSGTPVAGSGTAQPGADTPRDPAALDKQISQLDQQVQKLIQDSGENPTAAQALKILQLLAERNRLTSLRDGLANGGDPNDY